MLYEVDNYLQYIVENETCKYRFVYDKAAIAHAAYEWLCTAGKNYLYPFISKPVLKKENQNMGTFLGVKQNSLPSVSLLCKRNNWNI